MIFDSVWERQRSARSLGDTAAAIGLDRSWRVATVGSLIAALMVPILQFSLLFPLVGALPTWDQWSMVEVWEAHFRGGSVLPPLLAPYNGHLNIVPRFMFFSLGLLTGWDLKYEVFGSYALAFGCLFMLLDLLRRTEPRLLVLATPIALLVFSLPQYENFLSGYPMGQHLSQFMAMLALYVVSTSNRRRAFWAGLVCAMISTFSYGAGLAVWLAVLLVAVVRRSWSRLELAGWLACAAAVGLAVRAAASAADLSLPASAVDFFLALIGRSINWSWMPERPEAILSGAVLLAAFLGLALVAMRSASRQLSVVWVALGLLSIQSAVLVTLGRAAGGWQGALTSHYGTAVYPIAVAVLALLGTMALTTSRPGRSPWPALFAVAPILVAVQVVTVSMKWLPVLRGWAGTIRSNNCRIILRTATDQDIRVSHHPDPALVRRGSELLRTHHLGAFKAPDAALRTACSDVARTPDD